MLLKRLRHPGIPIVYDLQEDESFSYLIEEFLEGDSFYDIIRKKGHLNQEAVIRYGVQLCGLVDYLHSAEEVPILYLDLQPRNLILCHEQVKLLDFEHAGTCTEANQRNERYGTPGFYAPEQRQEGELGVYTDVYQIGAVLAYLLTGLEEQEAVGQIAGDLGKIIRRCLCSDGKERYPSVAEIGQELKLVRSETGVSDNQSTSLILAFVGTRPGIGVTHLALGASAYLNQRGYSCLYEEHNSSGDVRSMAGWLGNEMDSFGICRSFGVPMKPRYGEAVRMREHRYGIVVRDYGSDWKAAGEAVSDRTRFILILVTGGKWWQQEQGLLVRRKLAAFLRASACLGSEASLGSETLSGPANLMIIFNQAIPGAAGRRWMKGQDRDDSVCLKAPCFLNPFRLTEESMQFYEELCKRAADMAGADMENAPLKGRKRIQFWDSFVRNWEERAIQRRNRRSLGL